MPSTKAYRARKHEIEVLEQRLADTEVALREAQIHLSTMNEVKDALLAECKRLTFRAGIFEHYIRHAYWDDPEHPAQVASTIPKCLKPFDAIKYAGGPVPMICPPEGYQDMGCALPPPGWYCTRMPEHEGPCAALPKGKNR